MVRIKREFFNFGIMIKALLTISFLLILKMSATAQEIWTIGPMLHVNFGGEKPTVSFAMEVAYWNIDNVPYSVDFGLEFDRKKKRRIYSELQTGIGVAGISVGPVFQFVKGQGDAKLGLQGTAWINYYVGLDYRMRFFRGEKARAVGTYLKIPVVASGLETDGGDLGDWDGWDD